MRSVQRTRDLARIVDLPRRQATVPEDVRAALTRALSREGGSQQLRTEQAVCLLELARCRGLVAALRVGLGKTLLSLLAPVMTDAKRPLLLVPGGVIGKTEAERRAYAIHWRIPLHVRIMSYELLGRVQASDELERYAPDMVIADEVHRLKNPRAACSRRVTRYMSAHPETVFVALTGSLTDRSLRDFAHIVRWALKDGAPLPLSHTELEDWADALDVSSDEPTCGLGALRHLCTDAEADTLEGTRRAFFRRLAETPGIVVSQGAYLGSSLRVTSTHLDPPAEVQAHFQRLHQDWERPDGYAITEAVEKWRVARQLALGFHYLWSPPAPTEWLARRKVWARACREILANNRRNLDSELQVANAVRDGHYPEVTSALAAWTEIAPTFEPRTVPAWSSPYAVDAAAAWCKAAGRRSERAIVWYEHGAFARELSRRTGLRAFGQGGLDREGRSIESAADHVVLASIQANGTGRNLQAYSRGLITSPMSGGKTWEQLLGRMHREGQHADEVHYEVWIACGEHLRALEQAHERARFAHANAPQKLLTCDNVLDLTPGKGPAWAQ